MHLLLEICLYFGGYLFLYLSEILLLGGEAMKVNFQMLASLQFKKKDS